MWSHKCRAGVLADDAYHILSTICSLTVAGWCLRQPAARLLTDELKEQHHLHASTLRNAELG